MTNKIMNDDELKKVVGGAADGIYHTFFEGEKYRCSWGKNYRVYTINNYIECESKNTFVSCYLETFNPDNQLTCTPWNTTEKASFLLLSCEKI